MTKSQLRFKSEACGKRDWRGFGDYPAGGCARVLSNAGASAGARHD